jgi:hypothetical protein
VTERFLPPLPVDVTDPVTAAMCAETGHSCPACPTVARNLGANAHNALGAVKAALDGTGSWERARRELGDLERVLASWQAPLDGHFAALFSRTAVADPGRIS